MMLPRSLVSYVIVALVFVVQRSTSETIKASFVNVSPEKIQLFWVVPPGHDYKQENMHVGDIEPGEVMDMDVEHDHAFLYSLGGTEYSIEIDASTQTYLIGPDEVHVKCSTSSGDINAIVKPLWSPRGAARFLELVNIKYFDGCALNRVVKGFLTQFGISADYKARTLWRDKTIEDDEPQNIKFQPGYMSYAGSGDNSRSTEMFIVMPDTHESQLEYFGTNPWETPFGYVEKEDLVVVDKWKSYGDMPPWGEGPDPSEIYEYAGYDYLKKQFPELSYIQECRVVPPESKQEVEL